MKDFIEVTMLPNNGKLLINISSISHVEEYIDQTSRIVLKEKVIDGKDINAMVVVNHSYPTVVSLIRSAQQG